MALFFTNTFSTTYAFWVENFLPLRNCVGRVCEFFFCEKKLL